MKEYLINKLVNFLSTANIIPNETNLLALGKMLSNQQQLFEANNINDYEFKIFSQFGEDGIIQYLIKNIKIENTTFIEFGVEDYLESNTRFLMMNNNWSGFVMDGSENNINKIKKQSWFWKYNLLAEAIFITRENINDLIISKGFSNIGILSIDLDGNDYHILESLDLQKINPSILVLEYNNVFGKDRFITVPYDKMFDRTKAHFSNLYFGASLSALNNLASKKGYALVCSDIAGVNAFFVRKDLLNQKVKEQSVEKVFKESKTRESRDNNYNLSYVSGKDRERLINGLDVLNIITGEIEKL